MSADLLAEFGSPSSSSQKALHLNPIDTAPQDEFETFGQFISPNHPSATDNEWTDRPKGLENGGIERVTGSRDRLWRRDDKGFDVLFDASDHQVITTGEDDEWGEFKSAEHIVGEKLVGIEDEASVTVPTTASTLASKSSHCSNNFLTTNLLYLDDRVSRNSSNPSGPFLRSGNSQKESNLARTTLFDMRRNPSAPEIFTDEGFDEWAEFIDGEPEEQFANQNEYSAAVTLSKTTSHPRSDIRGMKQSGDLASLRSKALQVVDVRPTNIPPPLVLLQLFPPILEGLRDTKAREQASTDGQTSSELASRITHALKVASRIIAGRTLRWKRDPILSQSTKIGPARAGKSGGMKLNSVNKCESMKENQEVIGVIEVWRRHAHFFISTIQSGGGCPVPIATEKIRVETASSAQGAVTASHACAICGLRRDERIPKVDRNVEDSFGEWWAEHWGHTECKAFWLGNSNRLYQR